MFASSFGKTLERNYRERAPYRVGSDIRIKAPQGWIGDLKTAVPYLPEAKEVALAYRARGMAGTGGGAVDHQVLGIEPNKFPETAWFQEGFSSEPLQSLMWTLQAPYGGKYSSKTLTGEPVAIALWVKPEETYKNLTLWVRLKDGQNRYYTYFLGSLGFDEWRKLEVNLASGDGEPPKHPLTLSSIFVQGGRFSVIGPTGSIELDDLHMVLPDKRKEIIDGFTDTEAWSSFPYSSFLPDTLTTVQSPGGDGSALRFSWLASITSLPRGIYVRDIESPIPVIASRNFVERTTYRAKEQGVISVQGRYVPIVIREVVDFFPTMNPFEDRFIVADVSKLEDFLKLLPASEESIANEAWVAFDPAADVQQGTDRLKANLPRAIDIESQGEQTLKDLKDPLGAGGWVGFLFLNFMALTATVALAISTHAYLFERSKRIQHAVLHLGGVSRRQLVGMVLTENLMPFIISLLMGLLLGIFMGKILVDSFNFTERGRPIVPPLILSIDWITLGLSMLAWLAISFMASYVVALASWHIRAAEELRITE